MNPNPPVLAIGLVSLIAAVVGGSLKLFGAEFPLLKSGIRQALLAVVGIGVIALSFVIPRDSNSSNELSASPQATRPEASVPVTFPTFPPERKESPADVFLNRDSGPGGSPVLVSGRGFGAGERIVIRFHTDQVGSTTASAQGSFASVAVTIPGSFSKFAPQQFEIGATGQSTLKHASAPFTITG
jgi:hypothetical protein